MNVRTKVWCTWGSVCLAIFLGAISLPAVSENYHSTPQPEFSPDEVLSEQQWKQVDSAVDRALGWLASQQHQDGSFPTIKPGEPAVTSLCILSFLARGHRPGEGPYGKNINAGIDFVLSCQKANGVLCYQMPQRQFQESTASHTYTYNHAIAGFMLGEVYGMTDKERADRIRVVIDKALKFTFQEQKSPKNHPSERGGWRYRQPGVPTSADLSVTSWHLMFLRSAKNAGFEVPQECIDEGLEFVQRCFDSQHGAFKYDVRGYYAQPSRAMAAAGVLSLSLGGRHETETARRAGDWLLKHPFNRYNDPRGICKRFQYDAFYCSQAMYQLGGKYWAEFFPVFVRTCLAHQKPSGSWDPEDNHDSMYGNALSTSFVVLALTTPYQLLPIFQR